jgi:hypothetical protein
VTAYIIPRDVLYRVFGNDPRTVTAFEQQQQTISDVDARTADIAGTVAAKDATYITLSANADLPNERVLAFGRGINFDLTATQLTLFTDGPNVNGGFSLQMTVAGDSNISVPLSGIMATRENTETFKNKTLDAPKVSGLGNYANDAAAAAGGVPVTGLYRNGSQLMLRVV